MRYVIAVYLLCLSAQAAAGWKIETQWQKGDEWDESGYAQSGELENAFSTSCIERAWGSVYAVRATSEETGTIDVRHCKDVNPTP